MAFTPSNLISGFTKTRISPLNRITDAQKAPSTVYSNVESEHKRRLVTNTAQHVSESPFLQWLRDKKAAREEKQKPKTKSKAKPQGHKLNSKRKVRSPKTYSAAARMRTRSQAKRVQVNTEADENEGSEDKPEEDCSVQDDQEDDKSFCGVCEVKYGTELESKIWIECSNCKAWYHTSCVEVEDNNIPDVFVFRMHFMSCITHIPLQ